MAYDFINHVFISKAPITNLAFKGFAINGKGYIGIENGNILELWEYDPTSDQWTQKMSFPEQMRNGASTMSIGNKGYLYSGFPVDSSESENDFWEYDPAFDFWTRKTPPQTIPRINCICHGGAYSGFIGHGTEPVGNFFDDIWEYNPLTDNWVMIADPLDLVVVTYDFIYNNQLYIGGGIQPFPGGDLLSKYNFYKYNSSINSVNQIQNVNEIILSPTIVSKNLNLKSKLPVNKITIYNVEGRIAYLENLQSTTEVMIDVSKFASGLYIIQCDNKGVGKFLKQ